MTRESMSFDTLIIGAGPAGLAAAIHLAQLQHQSGQTPSICILEKGEYVGAHILAGAVLEPRALNALLPDWQKKYPSPLTPVTEDSFLFLTKKRAFRLPTPPQMKNNGNSIVSLGQLCRFMAEEAEKLGVNIFPGFAATEILYENNKVVGIITDDKGLDKSRKPTSRFQQGIEIFAKKTIFAEGCRGFLTEKLIKKFELRKSACPQTYALGIKELWEIPTELHQPGKVMHSIGWPLPSDTYGGSFAYHFANNLLAIGFVTGLDYRNPYINPYEIFQCFKTHPTIFTLLKNGRRMEYGARCLNEGGLQSIPQIIFPGGLLIGCAAGFLNVPKIKGIHTAMQSGILAAESIMETTTHPLCDTLPDKIKKSWIYEELYRARNIRPAMRWGLFPGLTYAAIDTLLLRGHAPWTLKNHTADNLHLKDAAKCKQFTYPLHDNKVTFDLMSSVFLAHTKHEEGQPCHLKLKNPAAVFDINMQKFANPETRYCPAGVYEILKNQDGSTRLHINAANCIHCKACDIKDPTQNITWTPPEGGSGPRYEGM